MRFAYADPPYLGRCSYYGHHHGNGARPFDGRCWDDLDTHRLLVEWLVAEYPDGWALSASAPSSRLIWPFAPAETRMAPWCKSFCAYKRNVRPAYAWEPVIYMSRANPPHRKHAPPARGGKATTPKDFFVGRIPLQKGFVGSKTPEFCAWVLALLNVEPGDQIDDIFSGTGIFAEVAARHVRPAQLADGAGR